MENLYETRRLVDEYLLFHYGSAGEILPWEGGPVTALDFPVRTVRELLPESFEPGRALDMGCAVGRSSFELSRTFDSVVGMDFSQAFIGAAVTVRDAGCLDYQMAVEGHLVQPLVAQRPEDARPKRVEFRQGDAMNLPGDLGVFDVVHAANLICRLSDPLKFLNRLPELVRPGGLVLLTTPCTWLAEFTPPERWPQGRTFDWLKEVLGAEFDLVGQKDLPFLIREHARKFQWSVAMGTVWRRR